MPVLLTAAPRVAEAQEFSWDVLCTITEVEVNGEASDTAEIRPGDSLREIIPLPPRGAPPTVEGDLENGGKGAYWDLENPIECQHLPTDGDAGGGLAGASRAITENGPSDAVAADSIGFAFKVGEWDIGRCGFGLRDDEGETLDTHDELPEAINLSQWEQRDCFVEGTSSVTDDQILARGRIEVVGNKNNALKTIAVFVTGGDEAGLIDAIEYANLQPGDVEVLISVTGGEDEFVFTEGYQGTENALPVITSKLSIAFKGTMRRDVTSVGPLRLARVSGGSLKILGTGVDRSVVSGFSSAGNGGALLLEGGGSLTLEYVDFQGNFAGGDGGAVWIGGGVEFRMTNTGYRENSSDADGGALAVTDMAGGRLEKCSFDENTAEGEGAGLLRDGSSRIEVKICQFNQNNAKARGGAVAVRGNEVNPENDRAPVELKFNRFNRNLAGEEGCDVHVNVAGGNSGEYQAEILFNTFDGPCTNARVTHYQGRTLLNFNTLKVENDHAALRTALPQVDFQGTVLQRINIPQQQVSKTPAHSLQSLCEEGGDGAFNSFGYNISSDDSCSLDQPTDLPSTDAMLSGDEGAPTPLPGSPAIDHGPAGLLTPEGGGKTYLPCGYRDVTGRGRPQDGDGDGGFECDSGAVEAAGEGAITAGHSAAFYEASRNNEGQYVEVLGGGVAVIYTFTYRPDGSGPAWILGLANVAGNSLVADELDRPVGTSFGEAFDTNSIDFSDWGGMSMVFPDCEALSTPGNVVYSGSPDLGYEPLITGAERITHITGCGAETPHANAGLSGSWYDPGRNGEGLVVQWLPDGSVLAIMFTYDTNGDQMWIFGVGQSDGKTVTIDAVYPTGFTSWGGEFDPDEVVLSPWGTFTLTWTDCSTLTFEYASNIDGYGNATRNYSRLTSLNGLTCPDF
jgi:hypothetical protein